MSDLDLLAQSLPDSPFPCGNNSGSWFCQLGFNNGSWQKQLYMRKTTKQT